MPRVGLPERFALLWLFALAVLVRTIVATRTSVIFEDGPFFLEISRAFSEGRFADAFAHPYHPLYSALVSAVPPLFADAERAALAVSIAGGAAAVVATFVLLREAFDERVAWIAGVLFAVSPYPVRFTSDVASEGVYLAFFVASVACFWCGMARNRHAWLWAAGAASGLAYLARPEGAGLLVIGSLWCAWRFARGERSAVEAAGEAARVLAGGLVFVLPYMALVSQQTGDVALSGKKSLARTLGLSGEVGASGLGLLVGLLLVVVAVLGAAAYVRRSNAQQIVARVFLAGAATAGSLFAVLAFDEARQFAMIVVSTLRPEVLLVIAVGIFAVRRAGWRERDAFFFFAFAAYAAVLVGLLLNYGYLSRRHFVPLMPFALGYAGAGVIAIASALAATLRRKPGVLAVAICLLLALIAAPKTLHDHRQDVAAQRAAAEWIAQQADARGRVAATKRRIGYYAKRRWHPLVDAGGYRALEDLAREKVRYVVLDSRVLADYGDPPRSGAWMLRELHLVEAGGRVATVYELTETASGLAVSRGT